MAREPGGKMKKALQRKEEEAREKAEASKADAENAKLISDDRPEDAIDPRAKSTRHGKVTADKWNQGGR
jgi:hypothetical protein